MEATNLHFDVLDHGISFLQKTGVKVYVAVYRTDDWLDFNLAYARDLVAEILMHLLFTFNSDLVLVCFGSIENDLQFTHNNTVIILIVSFLRRLIFLRLI